MRIEELHIYGYGKFSNQRITLDSKDIQVFYGPNEAGKSTIMSFIESILFGFPTKQQQERRFEPKLGQSYGGAVYLYTKTNGKVKVERTPGKAKGNVTIYLENGEEKDEHFLNELLQGLDKSMFRAIYSFDIHGLQHVHKLNGDQIGKYLFFSSIFGSDALFKMKGDLEKRQEELFKPTGKNPELNQSLLKLKKTYEQLTAAKQMVNEYEKLLQEKEEVHIQITNSEKELKVLQREENRVQKLKLVHPIQLEINEIQLEIKHQPDLSYFPVDGLSRLDKLESLLHPLKAQIHSLAQKMKRLQTELDGIEYISFSKEEVQSIKHFLSNEAVYRKEVIETEKIKNQIESLLNHIRSEKSELYPYLDHAEILDLPTDIAMKEAIRDSANMYRDCMQKKNELDSQFEHVKTDLEDIEWKVRDLESKLISKEERKKLEAKVNNLGIGDSQLNAKQLKEEHTQLGEQIQFMKQQGKEKKKQVELIMVLLSVLLIGASIWAGIQTDWLLLSAFVATFVLGIVGMKKSNSQDLYLEQMIKKEKQVSDQLLNLQKIGQTKEYNEVHDIKNTLWKDDQLNQMLQISTLELKQKERAYNHIISQFESWEQKHHNLLEKTERLLAGLKLEPSLTPASLYDSFDRVISLKNKLTELEGLNNNLHQLDSRLKMFEENVWSLAEGYSLGSENFGETIANLKEALELMEQAEGRKRYLDEECSETAEQLRVLQDEQNYIQNQIQNMMNKAKAESIEQFRLHGKEAAKRIELEVKLKWLTNKINQTLQGEKVYSTDGSFEEKLNYLQNKIQNLQEELKEKQERKTYIEVQLDEIEKSGLYSTLRHQYEQEKQIVKEQAEKWGVLSITKDLLLKTIDYHRQVRLPNLVKEASLFLKELTGGEYQQIYLPETEENIIAERMDGIRFYGQELSQATSEQLYVALRLALACTLDHDQIMPLVIDDSFVNFDKTRTNHMVKLLEKLSVDRQIIFFTCHEHLIQLFNKKKVLSMELIPVEPSVNIQ
ncbi:ATP-binding protein [Metabacillus arenae]|uniref:AAA family ATPase n=1 Tax=Metabacillus arenae TaxID=2771434 RepID=A0A926S3W5_9BACI|nr:AAA family ATPase [Metabacillus arenae]MBD1383374.1 AAA family ATPase [Metabacillus arenae]